METSLPVSTPVTRLLDDLGVPYRTFTHPGAVHSLEQAAAERGQRPEQVIRTALRKYLGVSRMSMASEEEVLAATGAPRGAVSPFGLPAPLRILADESIFTAEEVSIGSGLRGTTVILAQADLQRLLGSGARSFLLRVMEL